MAYRWPADTDFSLWELDVLDRNCPACGRMMHICDHRYRRFHTLDGPVQMICKLNHCPPPDRAWSGALAKTKSYPNFIEITDRPVPRRRSTARIDVDCFGCSRASALLAPHGRPLDPIRTPGRLRDQAPPRRWRSTSTSTGATRSTSRAAARDSPSHSAGQSTNSPGGDHPLHRWPPAREGARDPLRRAGVDPEAAVLVRRAVDSRSHRGMRSDLPMSQEGHAG